jgi:hypothetical protein
MTNNSIILLIYRRHTLLDIIRFIDFRTFIDKNKTWYENVRFMS